MSIYLLDTIDSLSVNNLSASNLANVAYSGSFNDLTNVPEAQSLSIPTSGNWNDTYTIVQNNSAGWSSAGTSNFNGQYSALEGIPSDATFSSSVSAPVVFTNSIKGDGGSWGGYSDPAYLGSVEIIPNESLYGQGQYLKIRPTSNFDEQHIHIESGINGDLVLGNDDFYYKLNGHARLSDNNYHNLAEIGVPEKNTTTTIVNNLDFNGGTLYLNLTSYNWAQDLSVGNIINVNGQSLTITTVGNVYYNNNEPFVQVVFYPSVSAAVVSGDSVEFNYKPRKIYSFDSSGNLNLPEGGNIKNSDGTNIIDPNWDSTYSTVLANSGVWSSVGTINNFNGQYSALANIPNFNQVAFDGRYSSLSGLPDSLYLPASADWNSNYSTVLANSALWSSVGAINNFNGQYSALANIPNFNQVAFDGSYNSLSGKPVLAAVATGGNYSDLLNKPQAVTDLIAGQVTGNLLITGALTAVGGVTFNSSVVVTTTSALSVVNTGPGPALYIQQGVGSGDIASFYDADGVEALHIGNAKNTAGQDPSGVIGINTSFPNKTLSVAGEISASQQIWAPVATFETSVSASALSGVHYGSGSSLTNLLTSNITGFRGSVSALLPVRSVASKYGDVALCSTDITFVNPSGGIDIGGGSWNSAPTQAVLVGFGGGSTGTNAVNIGYTNTVGNFSIGIGWQNRVGREAVLIGRSAGRNVADPTKTLGSITIGSYAGTTSQECLNVAVGHSANQFALDTGCSVAVGYGALASSCGISIGSESRSASPSAISLGATASAVNLGIAVGYGAKTICGLAIGHLSTVTGPQAIGIGNNVCLGTNPGSVVGVGFCACASNSDGSVVIGAASCVVSNRTTVVGAVACGCGNDSIVMGHQSRVNYTDSIAIGKSSNACSIAATVIGKDSVSTGSYSVGIGHSSRIAGNDGAVVVGSSACVTGSGWGGSVAIGCCSISTNAVIGPNACSTNYGIALGSNAVSNCNLAIASASVPISSTTATDFSGRYLPLNLNGTVGVVPVYANTAAFSAAVVRYAPAGSSSTVSIPTSANWDSTYTTVQSNSATWGITGIPNATFTSSVSAPSLSGSFYGDGNAITNLQSYNVVTPVVAETTDFTFSNSHLSRIVKIDTTLAPLTALIPLNSNLSVQTGTQIVLIKTTSDANTVTVLPDSGVTLISKNNYRNLTTQASVATLIKLDTDEWILAGSIAN